MKGDNFKDKTTAQLKASLRAIKMITIALFLSSLYCYR